jgi:peptidoglycan biosynthesis protein MviN/MurJ (putative lipid II flippase)
MRAELAKLLMLLGVVVFIIGLVVLVAPKIPWLGRLPGDIDFKSRNIRIYFPIVTCIILSILLTIILNLIHLFRR